MAYVAVAKALFEYAAQDPETELSFGQDQILYVIEKEDADWWKAKLKDDTGAQEGPVGLVPANYVEEIPPLNQTRAIYAYESTSPEELSMNDEDILHVYSIEADWLLVRVGSGSGHLGFVPKNYCEPLDESAEIEVADAAEGEANVEYQRQQDVEVAQQREVAERQRQLKLKDKVETWSIAEMDGKKKKKGSLGVGNGAVFFAASDTDKMTPVKQYAITELGVVSQPSSKTLELSFSTLPQPLLFNCGDSSTVSAIIAKLESSKSAAGEALEMAAADLGAADSGEERGDFETAAAQPKEVRFASSPTGPARGTTTATALYDFDAQGEDELSVQEHELVTIIDKSDDEWWSVRNASGQEGVVPAQYVQLNDGSAQTSEAYENGDDVADDDGRSVRAAEQEAAAAAALDAERQRERERKAEQRRAIEKAARDKQRQEEEDRRYALEVEEKEKGKSERKERRRQDEARAQREAEAEERREAARGLEPPKISKRPSAQNVRDAAASLPSSTGKAAAARPPENNRPKPHTGRTRVWSDKTGQFKVEAEYLGLNGNKIRLHKLNGVIIEVPIDKMSSEDVQMIKRHEARRAKAAPLDDDDSPLGDRAKRTAPPARSQETNARAESPPVPAAALEMPKPRKPRFDWFAFFLECGCDMDDCTRYAAAFERDRIDESILPDLQADTLRSLGLREGDVIRVRKEINTRFAKKTPDQLAQIKQDEDYARQLQEHENNGSKGPAPQSPPGLFTGPDGKLNNNTRRGRPDKKNTGPDTVDSSAIAAASDQLSRASVKSPSPPPVAASPPPEPKPQTLIGFDDDAWTIKPSTPKPTTPAPPAAPLQPAAPTSSLPLANTTDSLLAQISSLRPANTGMSSNNTGGSFDRVSQMVDQRALPPQQPMQPGSSGFSGSSGYGLGQQNTNQPMSSMMGQPNGSRGPLAPVPTNEGLLNPLQPAQTGFVPTRPGQQQQQGMMPQQTGWQQQQAPMMMQPTGYAAGFQQGYQQMQPNFTGYPTGFQQQQQQQQQTGFNAIANLPPPRQQENPDKFAPSNIFAAMKKQDFGKPEEQQPQQSNKYDALRPLATGYNGAPGMMPQQTGMMPQQTGMMPPQTGMMGINMGGGMMPQMTGYNGQMGYMGQQQNPYGQGYR